MKKILFLAIATLFVAGTASAQRYQRRPPRRVYVRQAPPRRPIYDNQVKIGIAGGVNFSNTVDAYNSNFSTSTIAGLHVGLTLDVPLARQVSFAPEVLFSQKGYEAETTYGNFKQRTNFIDIPLLAKIKLVPGFNFVIGPQVSFLTSTKNIYDNGFNTVYEESYNNRGDRAFIGGVLGVGIELNRNIELRGRYTIDLNQSRAEYGSEIPDYRNQVFQLGLNFRIQ
ncbi:PorT family protein [Inquilinus sp. KBS0705]|nr:PorT family protein [Inquilinus sp. KBS0705]